MNCRIAEREITMRDASQPVSIRNAELERHLAVCTSCRLATDLDRRVVAGLLGLRGRVPYEVDVRLRVLAEIDQTGASPGYDFSERELAWVTAVVLTGLIGLLAMGWVSWPSWAPAADSLGALGRGLGNLLSVAWGVATTLLAFPLRLLLHVAESVRGLLPLVSGFQPLAIVAVSASYLLMAFTIAHFVARDFRENGSLSTNGDGTA